MSSSSAFSIFAASASPSAFSLFVPTQDPREAYEKHRELWSLVYSPSTSEAQGERSVTRATSLISGLKKKMMGGKRAGTA